MPSVYMAARQGVKKRTTLQGLPSSSSSPSSRRPSQQLSFPATVLPAGVLPNKRPSQQLSFEALLPAAVLPSKRPSQQPSFPAAVLVSSHLSSCSHSQQPSLPLTAVDQLLATGPAWP